MSQDSKSRLTHQPKLDSIVRGHQQGAGGIRTALALTRRLDKLVIHLYQTLTARHPNLLSIVAIGGFGRKELCFSSDVDIMLLVEDAEAKSKATHGNQKPWTS